MYIVSNLLNASVATATNNSALSPMLEQTNGILSFMPWIIIGVPILAIIGAVLSAFLGSVGSSSSSSSRSSSSTSSSSSVAGAQAAIAAYQKQQAHAKSDEELRKAAAAARLKSMYYQQQQKQQQKQQQSAMHARSQAQSAQAYAQAQVSNSTPANLSGAAASSPAQYPASQAWSRSTIDGIAILDIEEARAHAGSRGSGGHTHTLYVCGKTFGLSPGVKVPGDAIPGTKAMGDCVIEIAAGNGPGSMMLKNNSLGQWSLLRPVKCQCGRMVPYGAASCPHCGTALASSGKPEPFPSGSSVEVVEGTRIKFGVYTGEIR